MKSYQFEKDEQGEFSGVSESDRPLPVRQKRAAKALGLSTDTLSKATQVVKSGDKDLIEKMDKNGE